MGAYALSDNAHVGASSIRFVVVAFNASIRLSEERKNMGFFFSLQSEE